MKKIYTYIKKLTVKCLNDDIFEKTASASFYILTTFFPFIILIFIIASSISLQMEDLLYRYLKIFPTDIVNIIFDMLANISQSKLLVSTALVMSLWTMSGAMMSVTKSFNKFYNVEETRNFVVLRLKCLVYAVLIIISIISCFILVIFGSVIGNLMSKFITEYDAQGIWNLTRFVFIIVAMCAVFAFLYKVIPNCRINVKAVLPGAIITTALWIGMSFAFSFYVNNFARYHIIYGSIAGIVMLITWTYMTSFIILIGGELNSVIHRLAKKNYKTVK